MSSRMVDPVVVYPETDSKKALVKLGIWLVKIYGNIPNKERNTQLNVTIKYPSLFFNELVFLFLEKKYRIKPDIILITDEIEISTHDDSL